jgi:hypothetical protein
MLQVPLALHVSPEGQYSSSWPAYAQQTALSGTQCELPHVTWPPPHPPPPEVVPPPPLHVPSALHVVPAGQ